MREPAVRAGQPMMAAPPVDGERRLLALGSPVKYYPPAPPRAAAAPPAGCLRWAGGHAPAPRAAAAAAAAPPPAAPPPQPPPPPAQSPPPLPLAQLPAVPQQPRAPPPQPALQGYAARERSSALLVMQRKLAEHQRALADGAAHADTAARRLAAAHARLADQQARRRGQRLLAACAAAWRRRAAARRAAHLATRRAAARRLRACWCAWRERPRLRAAAQRKAGRLQQLRLAQTLAAWHTAAQQRGRAAQQLARAARWHHRRVLAGALRAWAGPCLARCDAARCAAARSVLAKAVRGWRGAAGAAAGERRAAGEQRAAGEAMVAARAGAVLRRAWLRWARLPAEATARECGAAALAAVAAQLAKQWGLAAFRAHAREACAARQLALRRAAASLRSWRRVAAARARRARLLRARRAAASQLLLRRTWWAWRQGATAQARHAAAQGAAQLQDALRAAGAAADRAAAREAAAAEQARLLELRNAELTAQASSACAGALAGLQLAPALRWRSVAFAPGAPSLAPRARHAALALDALQPPGPGGGGCVLVFGGTAGPAWHNDLTLLMLSEGAGGEPRLSAAPVPAAEGGGGGAVLGRGSAAPAGWPAPLRDFAAAACGRDRFVVSGGFAGDGGPAQLELLLCTLRRTGDAAAPAGPGGAWAASWSRLAPRAGTRAPPARSHHSCCHDAAGRSLVVFGGSGGREGCLGDVWVFSMDHQEWWAPSLGAGAPRPARRRSHAAAVLGGALWVHGGLGADGCHLSDLWRLDLTSWQWQKLAQHGRGAGPPPRRAHVLEAVAGRFLLVHGGYSGTHELCGDTWSYDTHTGAWLDLRPAAPASGTPPTGRALHTLTLLGTRLLLLGGQGGLGPVGGAALLECPAVMNGLRLQAALQASQGELVAAHASLAAARSSLASSQSELADAVRRLAALEQQQHELAGQRGAAQRECGRLEQQLAAAQAAVAADAGRAAAAREQAAALQRRLARARHGGEQALAAADGLAGQLRAAEAACDLSAGQHAQAAAAVQQAEATAAALRLELAASRAAAQHAGAAADSARAAFQAAAEELAAGRQLAEELPALRARQAEPAAPAPPAGEAGPGGGAAARPAAAGAAAATDQLAALRLAHEEEVASLRRQLREQQGTAAAAEAAREEAVRALARAEARHGAELAELEARARAQQRRVWEVEADAAAAARSRGDQAAAPRPPKQAAFAPPTLDAACGDGAAAGGFSVRLVPTPAPGSDLELLPEVAALLQLQRSLARAAHKRQQQRRQPRRSPPRRGADEDEAEDSHDDDDSAATELTELSKAQHVRTVPDFAPALCRQLREVFDAAVADPRHTSAERFIWDYWRCPTTSDASVSQYDLHRTQASVLFPEPLHEALVDALLQYGERELGCRAISPVWVSYYVDGGHQALHCDSYHGPFAYVLSLTPWEGRAFTGGETVILQPHLLGGFWAGFDAARGLELPDLASLVPPAFGQLTLFDPRCPHGVLPVSGTRDPQLGRLVLHGWFTEPSPFFDGPLDETALDPLNAALVPMLDTLQALPPCRGTLSCRLTVSGETGRVRDVEFLADTLVALPAAAADFGLGAGLLDAGTVRGAVQHTVRDALLGARFPACAEGDTAITLPLVTYSNSTQPITLRVINGCEHAIEVAWVDYDGEAQIFAAALAPGAAATQSSFDTHVWRLRPAAQALEVASWERTYRGPSAALVVAPGGRLHVEPLPTPGDESWWRPEWGRWRPRGEVAGLAIWAFDCVCDDAVAALACTVGHMLSRARRDVLARLRAARCAFAIIGRRQATTDVPPHRFMRGAGGRDVDATARGLGATAAVPVASCGEENLLMSGDTRYASESIAVHEAAHAVMALGFAERDLEDVRAAYEHARTRRIYVPADCYAMENADEYWAEGTQAWFGATARTDVNGGVSSRAALRRRDPQLAALLQRVYGRNPWQYVGTCPGSFVVQQQQQPQQPEQQEEPQLQRRARGAGGAGGEAGEQPARRGKRRIGFG
ncbi:GPA3 [Scenedesmus sp. PABB004]|nr:GPA3 [Scenedesmus sp. PABB004]